MNIKTLKNGNAVCWIQLDSKLEIVFIQGAVTIIFV
jgi:hypothetical protein